MAAPAVTGHPDNSGAGLSSQRSRKAFRRYPRTPPPFCWWLAAGEIPLPLPEARWAVRKARGASARGNGVAPWPEAGARASAVGAGRLQAAAVGEVWDAAKKLLSRGLSLLPTAGSGASVGIARVCLISAPAEVRILCIIYH